MKLPLIRSWRWWMAAGAAALVLRRLQRKRPVKEATGSDEKRTATEAARKARANEDLRNIFSLARRLGAARTLQTDVGRDDCLLRAAEIVLMSPTAAGLFVATHRDAFRRTCKAEHARGKATCEKCGASVVEGTTHDEVLNERMPVWKCVRCGSETPR